MFKKYTVANWMENQGILNSSLTKKSLETPTAQDDTATSAPPRITKHSFAEKKQTSIPNMEYGLNISVSDSPAGAMERLCWTTTVWSVTNMTAS